jgi:hypothetical protein
MVCVYTWCACGWVYACFYKCVCVCVCMCVQLKTCSQISASSSSSSSSSFASGDTKSVVKTILLLPPPLFQTDTKSVERFLLLLILIHCRCPGQPVRAFVPIFKEWHGEGEKEEDEEKEGGGRGGFMVLRNLLHSCLKSPAMAQAPSH